MTNHRNTNDNTPAQEELLKIIKAFHKKNGVYPYTSQIVQMGNFTKQRISLIVQELLKRGVLTIEYGKQARQLTIK